MIECSICNGTGQIEFMIEYDGLEADEDYYNEPCPKCKGMGKVEKN